jgi:hypothetical protein
VSSTHLGPKTRFLLLSDSCGFVDVGRSLWREDGCHLQLLLAPASAVTLGPNPARLMTIFYCLRLDTPSIWRIRSPYLCPLGTRWPSYTPRHRVPFSSPPTTLRVTVDVFEPVSTRGWTSNRSQSRSESYEYFMTGQATWGSRPGFVQLKPSNHSLYVISSLTRWRVCLLWIFLAFCKCMHHTHEYIMLLKILPCALYTRPLVS